MYLAVDLKHPHYQIRADEVDLLMSLVRKARKKHRSRGGASFILVKASKAAYKDEFLAVLNDPSSDVLHWLDKRLVESKLSGCAADPKRNNRCIDLGFAGTRNSRRMQRHLGFTHSNLHKRTLETWSKDVFVGITRMIEELFGESFPDIYGDAHRNGFWSNEIAELNKVEALRIAETNSSDNLLQMHRDDGNSDDSRYSFVVCVSYWRWKSKKVGAVRTSFITYGKSCADVFMSQLDRSGFVVEALSKLWNKIPAEMKARDTSIFPRKRCDRKQFPYAFVDKMVFYSLFASAITQLFDTYPVLRNNELMACALLYNVVMSESPDHFWQICQELKRDACAITSLPFYDGCALSFGQAFAMEIFKRKKHSGNARAEKQVSYDVCQRHIPAVNTPPTFEKTKASVEAISLLGRELRSFVGWNITNAFHYYGKSVHYLKLKCHGAGKFTAFHLIGVGACIKLFPQVFVEIAEIGTSTRTWTFMKWFFGYKDEDAHTEVLVMLRALSVYLGISCVQAEELCCLFTKVKSPRKDMYWTQLCEWDRNPETLRFDLSRCTSSGGDVVYRDMRIYQIDPHGHFVAMDCHGTMHKVAAVLTESLMNPYYHKPLPGFWSSIVGRNFYYKRSDPPSRITHIKDYFVMVEDEDAYTEVERQRVCWDWTGDWAANELGRNIRGPALRSVIEHPEAREPLHIKNLVWRAVHGGGQFKKTLLRVYIDEGQFLYRPPCVAEKYQIMGQKTMYSCAIVLNHEGKQTLESVGRELYYPDPYFALYHCGTECALRKVPWDMQYSSEDVWRPKDRRWDHSEDRLEQSYRWNHSRVVNSEDYQMRRRLFANKKQAEYFALFEFFFAHRHLFDLEDPQVRSLLFLKPIKDDGPYGKNWRDENRLKVDHLDDVHVYFDSREHKSSTQRLPFLIAVKFPKGGRAYYLCDESGDRSSGVLLARPPSRSRRTDHPGVMYEFQYIVGHAQGRERKVIFPGSGINLLVRWTSGGVTEEPLKVILEDAPAEVIWYARDRKLLDECGWRSVKNVYSREVRKKRDCDRSRVACQVKRAKLGARLGLEDGELAEE